MPLGPFIYNHSFEDILVIKYEYQNYHSFYPLFLLATNDLLVIPFKPSLNAPHSYLQFSFANEDILDNEPTNSYKRSPSHLSISCHYNSLSLSLS